MIFPCFLHANTKDAVKLNVQERMVIYKAKKKLINALRLTSVHLVIACKRVASALLKCMLL